jgi:hypothetical protein
MVSSSQATSNAIGIGPLFAFTSCAIERKERNVLDNAHTAASNSAYFGPYAIWSGSGLRTSLRAEIGRISPLIQLSSQTKKATGGLKCTGAQFNSARPQVANKHKDRDGSQKTTETLPAFC